MEEKRMNNLTTFADKLKTKRKGFLSAELMIVIVITLILMVGAFIAYNEYKDNANRTVAMQDMQILKQGVISYSGLRSDSALPSDLGDLITGITATNSIDGVQHNSFIQRKGWTTASNIKDPWGVAYAYSYNTTSNTGSISCTHNGTTLTVNF